MPGFDDAAAKKPSDWTQAELDAAREDFLKSLSPENRARPEYYPVGDPKGPKKAKTHVGTPHLGAAALQDDTNPVLIAAGAIAGSGVSPTAVGKIYNWGSLSRTGAGVYTIALGEGGVADAQMIFVISPTVVAAGLPFVALAGTGATPSVTKQFTIKDNNVAVDTMTFGFAIYKMPNTA